MICVCKKSLAALPAIRLGAHLTLHPLALPRVALPQGALPQAVLPQAVLSLSAHAGLPAALIAARSDVSLLADLSLPPFPLHLSATAGIPMALAIAAQLAVLKLDLGSATIENDISALLLSIQANLPSVPIPLPSVQLGMLAQIGSLLAGLRAQLGIDLFTPAGAAALSAALGLLLRLRLPIPLPQLRNAALYANLQASLGALGGIHMLLPTLRQLMTLKLPRLRLDLPRIAALLSLSSTLAAISAGFGVDLTLPGGLASLHAKLSLLASLRLPLASLSIAANVAAAVQVQSVLPVLALLPSLSAHLHANLGAIVGLTLPTLVPLSLAASLGGLALTTRAGCGGACPVKAH